MPEINDSVREALVGIRGIISSYIKDYVYNDCIVDIANEAGLTNYIPGQLEYYKNNDFNYDIHVLQLLFNIYEKEANESLEIFFQSLFDNIKKYQGCRRFRKEICNLPRENLWSESPCHQCDFFIDNGIKKVFSKHLSALGLVVDNEGFILSTDTGKIDIEKEISKNVKEISSDIIQELLPDDIRSKGKKMSEVYTFMYCVENSLRIFIDKTFIDYYGKEYLDKIKISTAIKRKIEGRKNDERRNKWLPIRGSNDFFYLDLIDLGIIIQTNWEIFKQLFPDQNWIKGKIQDLSKCRNLIAHNSYVKRDERELIKVYYKQILKQIQSNG